MGFAGITSMLPTIIILLLIKVTFINLTKKIYLYNLITYSGKLGMQTFTKLFEDYQRLDVIKSFHNYENQLDKSNETMIDFSSERIFKYLVRQWKDNDNAYIRQKNQLTGRYEILKPVTYSEDGDAYLRQRIIYIPNSSGTITLEIDQIGKVKVEINENIIKRIYINGNYIDINETIDYQPYVEQDKNGKKLKRLELPIGNIKSLIDQRLIDEGLKSCN